MRTLRLTLAVLAALPLGGCFLPFLLPGLLGGGGGRDNGPTPTVSAAVDSPAARAAAQKDAQAQPTGPTRRALPTAAQAAAGPLWEVRTYAYMPFNSRGESGLQTLLRTLGPEGWELESVSLSANGPSVATFRRMVLQPRMLQAGAAASPSPASAPPHATSAGGRLPASSPGPSRDLETPRPAAPPRPADSSPFIPRTDSDIEGRPR